MTDQDLMEQIQYTMIEPPNGGQSWPSELWSRDEVLDYINERQDAFVKATHVRIAIATIPVQQGTFRYALPADWVATVRLYWQPATTQKKALVRSSSWEADHGLGTWTNQGIPKVYMDGDTPSLIIQIAPVPSVDCTLELIYIANCTALLGNGATLDVADEFIPTIKYGALADMFGKVGRAHDPIRAQYCEERYNLGVEMTRTLLKGFRS